MSPVSEPFNSVPIDITPESDAGGLAGLPAFVGFGSSAQGLTLLGSTIDITNAGGTLSNFAFQFYMLYSKTPYEALLSIQDAFHAA